MNFLRYFISKYFWISLLAMIVLFLGTVAYLKWRLDVYTFHKESITVPDLEGVHVDELDELLSDKDLLFEVKDSVFVPGLSPLTVVEQLPLAKSKIKRFRTIFVTINTDNPPKVKFPAIKDVSLRQAMIILESYHLEVGELDYRPDYGHNVVIETHVEGKEVKAGDKVAKGKKVDLILGDGFSSGKVKLPNLSGITLDEALFHLKVSGLNIGSITFEDEVKDSASAVIYRQVPVFNPEEEISQGEAVDIWLITKETFEDRGLLTRDEEKKRRLAREERERLDESTGEEIPNISEEEADSLSRMD